ncbi:hypothetical protein RNH99_12320 [Pseudomonas paraeruginosa]|uniref:hypothetical protein n=1 Tax=Pseudomonas aeruginosa group TaxID=136841 RepID=UPI000B32CE96|nr:MULTISPECIES: hypothetical protein [Pseudomonas aeruginosa group]MDT1024802.1 hypothetical protein [Pseudomonas paraeruginosa]
MGGGQGQERGTGSQDNGGQQAPGSDPLHGVSSSFSYRFIEAFVQAQTFALDEYASI